MDIGSHFTIGIGIATGNWYSHKAKNIQLHWLKMENLALPLCSLIENHRSLSEYTPKSKPFWSLSLPALSLGKSAILPQPSPNCLHCLAPWDPCHSVLCYPISPLLPYSCSCCCSLLGLVAGLYGASFERQKKKKGQSHSMPNISLCHAPGPYETSFAQQSGGSTKQPL